MECENDAIIVHTGEADEVNRQFIQSLSIDWNKIDNDSYLREIEAINQLEEIVFEKPITFFVGENGSGKSTLLEALSVSYGWRHEKLFFFNL